MITTKFEPLLYSVHIAILNLQGFVYIYFTNLFYKLNINSFLNRNENKERSKT